MERQTAMSTHPRQFNYLKKKKKHQGTSAPSSGGNPGSSTAKQFSRLTPDSNIHVPPLFMFVSRILQNLDTTTQMFMTFFYAAALYCLSTVAFVRSVEYVWSGIAATAQLVKRAGP